MAIFHFSVKCFSRSAGHSAIAAAAYRAGHLLRDERTGEVHDYRHRRGVVHSRLIAPWEAPGWTRAEYWNEAEAAERRKNSCVAREAVLALPYELPLDAQIVLADQMGEWISERHRNVVDRSIHTPTQQNDQRNVHAHLLMSTRRIDSSGFGSKTRELDSKQTGPDEIRAWRERWCDLVNETLMEYGIQATVDHRSHAELGLAQLPTVKEGRGSSAAFRRKQNAMVRDLNIKIRRLEKEDAMEFDDSPAHDVNATGVFDSLDFVDEWRPTRPSQRP